RLRRLVGDDDALARLLGARDMLARRRDRRLVSLGLRLLTRLRALATAGNGLLLALRKACVVLLGRRQRRLHRSLRRLRRLSASLALLRRELGLGLGSGLRSRRFGASRISNGIGASRLHRFSCFVLFSHLSS